MSKRIFDAIGGFDPVLRSNEDSEFCSRARARGIPVLVFPRLATVHFGAERNLRHFVARQWWHGSNVIGRSGWGSNRRAVSIAAYTLACVVAALIGGSAGDLTLFGIAFFAIICPPLWVVFRGRHTAARGETTALFVLVLVYALVRAAVLPVAFGRFLTRAARGPTNHGIGTADEKCT